MLIGLYTVKTRLMEVSTRDKDFIGKHTGGHLGYTQAKIISVFYLCSETAGDLKLRSVDLLIWLRKF